MVWMNRRHTYPPVRQCIYCGAGGHGQLLGDEHIIAYSLGGTLILPNASCTTCGTETGKVEQHCTRTLFWPVRVHQRFPSRKRSHPRSFPVEIDHGDRTEKKDVPIEQHPGMLVSFAFSIPGILINARSDTPMTGNAVVRSISEDFDRRVSRLGGKSVSVNVKGDAEYLARMLAKIAHAYAVAELGLTGFKPMLLDIVLGRRLIGIDEYVGGAIGETPKAIDVHELDLDKSGLGMSRFVVVRIRLFGEYGMPVYYVVVGRAYPESSGLRGV